MALRIGLIAALFAGFASNAFAEDPIKVEKGKPAVEYKRFDPARLPDPAPPLGPGESAVCVYQYELRTDGQYSFRGAAVALDGRVKQDLKIERLTMKLSLTVTIWLPKDAPKGLEAHEDGHRIIAETFYGDADKIAMDLAKKAMAQPISGEGKDRNAAGKAAMDKINQALLDDYLSAVAKPCETAQGAFDRMTDHGRKEKPTAKEAVEGAVMEGRK